MRYTTNITLNPTTTAPVTAYIKANGMFDPEVALGGHQPRGFDQWMRVYDHFTVVGSKITVQQLPTTTNNVNPGLFGVILDDNTTFSYTSGTSVLEGRQGGNHKIYGPQISTGKNTPTVRKGFSARKFFTKKDIIGSEGYKGSASADPTEGAYFGIWASAASAGPDPAEGTFLVTVDYIARFTEPKFLAAS